MVAEKSSVWCCSGSACMMRRTEGQKPMSSMRSASSRTRTSTPARLTWLCSMRSSRRPGVATSRSQPFSSAAICLSNLAPPMTMTARCPVFWQTTFTTSSICAASSRVGVTTSACGPWPDLPAMRCSVGRANAAVLPVPVWAEATTSLPARTSGMAPAWTGVGVEKPRASTPARICSFSPSSANEVVIAASIQQIRSSCTREGLLAVRMRKRAVSISHSRSGSTPWRLAILGRL